MRVTVPGSVVQSGEPIGSADLTVPLGRVGDRPVAGWTVQGTSECGGKPEGYEPVDRELLSALDMVELVGPDGEMRGDCYLYGCHGGVIRRRECLR